MHKPKCPPGHAFALKLEPGCKEWKTVAYPAVRECFMWDALESMVDGEFRFLYVDLPFCLIVNPRAHAEGLAATIWLSTDGGPQQPVHGPVAVVRFPRLQGGYSFSPLPSGLRPKDVDRFTAKYSQSGPHAGMSPRVAAQFMVT